MAELQAGMARLTLNPRQVRQHLVLDVPATTITQTAVSPRPRWTMVVSEPIVPLAIETKVGLRSLGLDFTFSNGVITWAESPHDLFSLPSVRVRSYYVQPYSLWNYPLRIDAPVGEVAEVTKYYRNSQDPAQLQRAVAAAAGFSVLPFTSTLRAISGRKYVFDDGVVTADYTHTPLTVGQSYTEGTVVGDMVKAVAAPSLGKSWHRALDWSGGMSLDHLCPFQGLEVPDGQRRLSTTTASTVHAGKYHVRANLNWVAHSGSAVIAPGVTQIRVNFPKLLASKPVVIGAPVAGNSGELSAVTAAVVDVSASGFSVVFSGASAETFYFHWRAGETGSGFQRTLIPAGSTNVAITYPAGIPGIPAIVGCLETDFSGDVEIIPSIISEPTTTGFNLLLSGPPSRNIYFCWTAVTPTNRVKRELVPAGTSQLTIEFAETFMETPLLIHNLQNADPDTSELIPYVVTQLSTGGFKLLLSSPTAADSYFHWSAETDYVDRENRFWGHQAAMEDITGKFLADVVGLSSPGYVSVNLIDLYFEHLLGGRGLVVDLKKEADNDDHIKRAERFLLREKPIGAALILRRV
jgi:hypothetical protein